MLTNNDRTVSFVYRKEKKTTVLQKKTSLTLSLTGLHFISIRQVSPTRPRYAAAAAAAAAYTGGLGTLLIIKIIINWLIRTYVKNLRHDAIVQNIFTMLWAKFYGDRLQNESKTFSRPTLKILLQQTQQQQKQRS